MGAIPLSETPEPHGHPLAALRGLIFHLEEKDAYLRRVPRPGKQERQVLCAEILRVCEVFDFHLARLRLEAEKGWPQADAEPLPPEPGD